jgi:hypothetical protein
MTKNSELRIDARYIHTGNSGVTLTIERDVRKPTRGILKIRNGAFGAFSTEMEVRGNDYDGMTANQLRDLALLFLESAHALDEIENGKDGDLMYSSESSPSIVSANGSSSRELSNRMEKFLRNQLIASGDKHPWNTIEKMKQKDEPTTIGSTEVATTIPTTVTEFKIYEKSLKTKKKKNREIDRIGLMTDRIKDLASKL